MTRLRAGSATDVGLVRSTNQDQLLVASPLFAVADGMGGHAAGEVASRVAVEALESAFEHLGVVTAAGLGEAARAANRAVWEQAQTDPELRGMGTTLVAIALVNGEGEDEVAIVNVGDSRAYRLRDGQLEQLTVDHSLVQELVAEGRLGEDEVAYHPQRHVLTRALGVDPDVAVDVLETRPAEGDRYLLCSDGLIREVGDDQVASVLRRLDDPGDAARELVQQAREHGGADNITVVIVDVTGDGGADRVDAGAGNPTGAVTTPEPFAPENGAEQKGTAPSHKSRLGMHRRRRGEADSGRPRARFITLRVVVFLAVFAAMLAIAAGAIWWYARGSYFVGLSGNQVTIFRGRPGGLMWFQPTVAQRTPVTTADVLPYHIADLRAGQPEATLGAARAYVQRLESEYSQASSG